MKIAIVSSSLSRQAGGIFEIEVALAKRLQETGVACKAYGLKDADWNADASRWLPVAAKVFESKGPSFFGYAPDLLKALLDCECEVVHLQTMWMYPSLAVTQWSRTKNRPYIITPNGMLEPWALNNSAWKKRLAARLYENRMLNSAACLQANTEKELRDIRAFGLKNPVAIIPNGIDLPEDDPSLPAPWQGRIEANRKVLLYLGRLHPKKNLAELVRAWAQTLKAHPAAGKWLLAISGWDQGGYENELKSLATELGLPWDDLRNPAKKDQETISILFTGPQFNVQKSAAYFHSDAFVLPSLSEGLPMVVLEAWAYRLPVLMTAQCNLPEGFAMEAAIEIGKSSNEIAEGFRKLVEMTPAELRLQGENGRKLVEAEFTWARIAEQMKALYAWVLGHGDQPNSVHNV